MNPITKSNATALIERILTEFHEPHLRDLRTMADLARKLNTQAALRGMADELETFRSELEAHMFKEEMRLFPMMEQGGNTLIQHLMDDMVSEHVSHTDFTDPLTAQLNAASVSAEWEEDLATLRRMYSTFMGDLQRHVRFEEDVLFPLFVAR